ncbi:MAG: DUF1311 domain-containing protein [Bacteroidales bacterium]|nr:DUF1311 domain-containing protein [Bacteroidales bacterium]MDD4821550.1 DUF1311 domain-containing protein [Bacteroidales bacterium]
MRQIAILLFISLYCLTGFCQSPRQLTKQDSAKIEKQTKEYLALLQERLQKETFPADSKKKMIITFTLDTCRIERIASEQMKIDFSTAGMSNAVNELNKQYDQLLNTYYQKLLAKLKDSDKELLKQAQRNWIQFRESELKLINLLSEDKYSGGGTIQTNRRSVQSLNLTKQRLIELVHYWMDVNN